MLIATTLIVAARRDVSSDTGGAVFGPLQDIAKAVDDAPAVASELGAEALPSKIVERALFDAQTVSGFIDREKRIVGISKHASSFPTCCRLSISHAGARS